MVEPQLPKLMTWVRFPSPAPSIDQRRFVHFVLDADKIKRAQKILETETETETIEHALDHDISEDERNRRAWSATERFIKTGVVIADVFGSLGGK